MTKGMIAIEMFDIFTKSPQEYLRICKICLSLSRGGKREPTKLQSAANNDVRLK